MALIKKCGRIVTLLKIVEFLPTIWDYAKIVVPLTNQLRTKEFFKTLLWEDPQ